MMAKRTRRSQRPSAPGRSPKQRPLALLARRFSDAQAHFQKVEPEYNKAKDTLGHARADLLLRLGNPEPMEFGTPGRRSSVRRNRGSPREGTLGAMIVNLMNDGTDRRTGDIVEALKSKGRKSKGSEKGQRSMIAQALSKLAKSGMIQKKGRGIYGK